MVDPDVAPVLELVDATKEFLGTKALDGVSFDFVPGRSTRWWGRTAPASPP